MELAPARNVRPILWTVLLAAAALATSPAHSVTLEVRDLATVGGYVHEGQVFVPVGGSVTIGSAVTGAPGELVAGLGISYFGYDQTIIDAGAVSVDPSGVVFGVFCDANFGEVFGLSSFQASTPIPSPAFFGAREGQQRVRVYSGFRTTVPQVQDPSYSLANSAGIDGVCGGGDADFRVTFSALAEGTTTITIGTGDDAGGIVLQQDGLVEQATNATVQVTVPEPGYGVGLMAGVLVMAFRGLRGRAPRDS